MRIRRCAVRLMVQWKYGFKSIKSIVRCANRAQPNSTGISPRPRNMASIETGTHGDHRLEPETERRVGEFRSRATPVQWRLGVASL